MNNPFQPMLRDSQWLEMLFANRNKNYGAFYHRILYSKHMVWSFAISVFVFFILILSPYIKDLWQLFSSDHLPTEYISHEVNLSQPPAGTSGTQLLPKFEQKNKKIINNPKPDQEKISSKPKVVRNEPDEKKIVDSNPSKNTNASDTGESTPSDSGQKGIEDGSGQVFNRVSQMPIFAGCDQMSGSIAEKKKCSEQRLLGFLKSNIKYPAQAIRNKTEGIVILQFIVEKNGSISNIEIRQDIGDGCGAEARRVIELLNSLKLYWSPGLQGSVPVRVQYTLPVEFEGS